MTFNVLDKDTKEEKEMKADYLKQIFQNKRIIAVDMQRDDEGTALYFMFDDLTAVAIELDPDSKVEVNRDRMILGLQILVRELEIWDESEWEVPPTKPRRRW